jgi:hypothetical protein
MNVVSIGLTVFGPTGRYKVCMRTWASRSPCFRCASTSSTRLTLLGPGEHGYVAVTIADDDPPATAKPSMLNGAVRPAQTKISA